MSGAQFIFRKLVFGQRVASRTVAAPVGDAAALPNETPPGSREKAVVTDQSENA